MPSADELDAVTVDAHGTLLLLDDPVPVLVHELRAFGVERDAEAVARAFRAEVDHYRPRSLRGSDPVALRALREECVAVFLAALSADLEPAAFVEPFLRSIGFRPAEGAQEALEALAAAGIALACVANWDVGLHEHLEAAGLADRFQAVVASAEAGAEKPDPAIFELALGRLGVPPSRALHIGDEDVDRQGAAAAGMAFEPVPLATLPGRLGLSA